MEIDDATTNKWGKAHGLIAKNKKKSNSAKLKKQRARSTPLVNHQRKGTKVSDISGSLHSMEDFAQLCSNHSEMESSLTIMVQATTTKRKKEEDQNGLLKKHQTTERESLPP